MSWLALLLALPAAALEPVVAAKVGHAVAQAPRYRTSCRLEGGEGVGYLENLGRSSLRVRGKVWFYFYEGDREIEREDERASKRVGGRDTEEIERTEAPDDADRCVFDVGSAVEGEDEPGKDVTATCVIVGDNEAAQAFVHNRGSDSVEIDGEVVFRFYRRSGSPTSTRSRYVYKLIPGGRSKMIKEISSVPSSAASCDLDLSGALEDAS